MYVCIYIYICIYVSKGRRREGLKAKEGLFIHIG